MSDFSTLLVGFLTAFFVVMISMPSLIKVAKLKHLVDSPREERKMHRWSIPTLGGVVIFGAIVFSYSLWFPNNLTDSIDDLKYIFSCLILLSILIRRLYFFGWLMSSHQPILCLISIVSNEVLGFFILSFLKNRFPMVKMPKGVLN